MNSGKDDNFSTEIDPASRGSTVTVFVVLRLLTVSVIVSVTDLFVLIPVGVDHVVPVIPPSLLLILIVYLAELPLLSPYSNPRYCLPLLV